MSQSAGTTRGPAGIVLPADPPLAFVDPTPARTSAPYKGRETVAIPEGSWSRLLANQRLLRAARDAGLPLPRPRLGKWKSRL